MPAVTDAGAKCVPHSPRRVPLLISQPHPQQQEAEQRADVVECACVPGGGAVAQVGVAAVDAHPGQLLLLAVPGGGTAAGQNDAQGSYRGRKEGGRQTDSQPGKSDELVYGSARKKEHK